MAYAMVKAMAYLTAYRWSIFLNPAQHCCKQRVPSICHTCDSLLSSRRRFAKIFRADSLKIGIREPRMPYKHNFWGTIVRKGNYHKAHLANFRALRPVHFVHSLALGCLFSDARHVKCQLSINYVIHMTIALKMIILILKGFTCFLVGIY